MVLTAENTSPRPDPSEAKFRSYIDHAPDGVFVADRNGRFLEVNPAATRITGYSEAELLGMSIQDLSPAGSARNALGRFRDLRRRGASFGEMRFVHRNGATRWWSVDAVKLSDTRYLGFVKDITSRIEAEEALRQSELRARAMLKALPDLMFRLDSQGVFLDYKAELSDLYTQSEPTLVGRRNRDVSPPEFADLIDRQITTTLDTRALQTFEYQLPIPGVGVRDYEARMVPSGASEVTAVVRDITRRRRAEEALRESQEKYRALIENMNAGVFQSTLTGEFLHMNSAVAEMAGYGSVEELMAKPAGCLYADLADRERLKEALMQRGEVKNLEFRSVRKDGTRYWISMNAVIQRDKGGKPEKILGIVNDITERRQNEELLRSQFQHSPDIILIIDRGYRIEAINRVEAGDFTVEGMKGMDCLAVLPPEERASVKQAIDRCFDERKVQELEHCIGEGKWVRARIVPMNHDSQASRAMIISMDITGRKRAEEEKAQLQERLQQAQKMESVGRLAGGVAHDFNNMLGVILGHVDMARAQVGPEQPLNDDLGAIRKAAERSAELTRQLLAFARKQTVAPKVVDLNQIVANTLKMLERLIGEDIQLDWRPAATVWPVRMDPSQLEQILANLCVNARDAITDVGKITIETSNISFDKPPCAGPVNALPGEYVSLSVRDDGCGMDRETLANVFEPFFTTKEFGKGTGLGLATVYGAVNQNEGFVYAASEPGMGSTFTIYLPRHVGKAETARTEGEGEPVRRGQETILLVEDEPAILHVTKRILTSQGYRVLPAITPGEALRLARENDGEIHLLVTDVVMPEMNGRNLAKNLLSLYPNLKRLFMSGYTADVIAHRGILDEGVNFIQKPFSATGLATRVREVLEER